MSGGLVLRHALRAVVRADLPPVAESDVVAVLEHHRSGPLDFLYEAAVEPGLARDSALGRAAAVFLSYCAGQLADDLADRDCSYLEEPWKTGPVSQFVLQNLFFAGCLAAGLERAPLEAAVRDLVRGAGPQHLEVRTRRWTLALARQVAEGIAGRQFAAYLRILWAGTALEPGAEEIGLSLGIAAHVAQDARSSDPRFWSLAEAERCSFVSWAREHLARVSRGDPPRCTRAVVRGLEAALAVAA